MTCPKSDRIAAFITDFDLEDAPAELIDLAEIAFVDTIGVMLAVVISSVIVQQFQGKSYFSW